MVADHSNKNFFAIVALRELAFLQRQRNVTLLPEAVLLNVTYNWLLNDMSESILFT